MSNFVQETLHASGAETADGNSEAVDVKLQSGPFAFVLDVTAQSGTAPTLDVDIEGYDPTSNKWVVLGSFTQVTTTLGTSLLTLSEIAFARIRAAWDIGGTSPNYTFSLGMRKPRY